MISVVIPTRDRRAMLPRTLAPLVRRSDVDVIVSDDGSLDGSADEAAALGARVVRSEQARGPAAARNAALAEAHHDLILFLDSDIVVEDSYLDAVMACHDAVDDLVLAGLRRQLPADGAAPSRRDSREALAETWSYNLARHPHPWAAAFSCVLSAPRSLLERAALPDGEVFDEAFMAWGLEDIELGLRLHQNGARWALAVGAHIEHQYHDRTMSRSRFAGWQANLERMLARHPQASGYRELSAAFDPDVRADFVERFRAFSPVPAPTPAAVVVRTTGDRAVQEIEQGLDRGATVYLVVEEFTPWSAVELAVLDAADRVALFDRAAWAVVGPALLAQHEVLLEEAGR